jgi:hypothetical protein
MFSKGPKNTDRYYWTEHAKFKMSFYGLSPQKVLGIISRPSRKEEGIVEKTVAVMKPVSPKIVNGKETWKSEVWAMYQKQKNKLKIISAWRYPGVSPKRNPIPEDILAEIVDKI